MTPRTPLVREVCGGVLARAAEKYAVGLYGYVFLSNHFHLMVRGRGPSIAGFMRYLSGNLAKKLGQLCSPPWRGGFWERRFAAEPILDAPAMERRLAYVLAHGVKEGLVARVADWEGLHCAGQLLDGLPLKFPWFDWTRRWTRREALEDTSASRWGDRLAELVELKLDPLPHWSALSPSERSEQVRQIIVEVERQYEGKPVMGMEAVKRLGTEVPSRRKLSRRPICHVTETQDWVQFRDTYRDFLSTYRGASARWRKGDVSAEFPEGAFKPGIWDGGDE